MISAFTPTHSVVVKVGMWQKIFVSVGELKVDSAGLQPRTAQQWEQVFLEQAAKTNKKPAKTLWEDLGKLVYGLDGAHKDGGGEGGSMWEGLATSSWPIATEVIDAIQKCKTQSEFSSWVETETKEGCCVEYLSSFPCGAGEAKGGRIFELMPKGSG